MHAIETQASPTVGRVAIDGIRWASFRPIEPSDRAGLAEFYDALSPESRRRRFLSGCRVSPSLVDRLAADPGVVAVLVEPGPRDGEIVGHASVQPDGRGGAEIAFAVADRVQRRGIGRRLVVAALGVARSAGLERASATLLADNAAMRRLLTDTGHRVVRDALEAGTEEIVLDLATAA